MRTIRTRAAAGALIAVALASGLAGVVLGRAWGVSPPAERTAPADLATTPGPAPRAEAQGPAGRPTTPSRRSAAAAAASFTSVLGGALALDRARYRAALVAIATPEARPRLLASAERTLDALDRGLGLAGAAARGEAVVLRSVPVAYSLDAFSLRVASVRIWFATVFSARGGLAQAWGTATLGLRWLAGWKLADWETAAGPTPSLPRPPDPVSVRDLGAELAGFSGFRQLPGAP